MADIKKVAWNASQGLIQEISNRRTYANTFFVNGDIKKAFNTLISIKQSVIQSLDQYERKELKIMEDNFLLLSSALSRNSSMSFNRGTRNLFNSVKVVATKIYSIYNDKLMDLLDKYGYLIGEQTDSSKMRF